MFEFFDAITGLIGFVIDSVVNVFEMGVFFFTQIPKAAVYVYAAISYLPAYVGTFIILFIALSVIITVLNRVWGSD